MVLFHASQIAPTYFAVLRRQRGIDDARVSKREVLIRRGDQWFRYGAPKRSECVELDSRSLSKCDRELTVKSCTQVGANCIHGGNDDHRNTAYHESIFDGSCAGVADQEADDKLAQ